jgi:5,10-methylenetetrahydromethanopterin reductase
MRRTHEHEETEGDVKVGVWFTGDLPPAGVAELAHRAEEVGVDSVWVAEGYYGRDAYVLLSAIALATRRVEIGPAVVNPFNRHPTVVAVATATLDELSGGRATVGIGSGPAEQLGDGLGFVTARPLRAVRESVHIIRTLLQDGHVDFEGETFRARHVHLPFTPPRADVPCMIAASGPKMVALAGELAESVYLAGVDLDTAAGWIGEGAARAGKDPRSIETPYSVSMSVAEDGAVAERRARTYAGMMLQASGSEASLQRRGLDPAIADRIREAVNRGGPRAAADLVPDEILYESVVGDPQQCLEQLQQRVAEGMHYPIISVKGRDARLAVDVVGRLISATKGKQA